MNKKEIKDKIRNQVVKQLLGKHYDCYNKQEHNSISLIVEKQCVAAYPYRKIINEIVQYIYDYINNNIGYDKIKRIYKDNNGKDILCKVYLYHIKIPFELTNKIDILYNLSLIINLEWIETPNGENIIVSQGNGITNVKNTFVNNNKLHGCKSEINCYKIDDNNINYGLIVNLYHEITHYVNDYNRLKNSNNTFGEYVYNEKSHLRLAKYLMSIDDEYDKIVGKIIYRLFDKDEISACAGSVYAYLKEINSDKTFYYKDIEGSQAWKEWHYFKTIAIPKLENLNNNDYWNSYEYMYNGKNNNSIKFKEWFIKTAKEYNNYFLYKIGHSACLYYNEK